MEINIGLRVAGNSLGGVFLVVRICTIIDMIIGPASSQVDLVSA